MGHCRRENYWSGYHRAHATKKSFVIPTIKRLVEENPPPETGSGLGRPKVYPARIMGTICILIQVEGLTFRDAENAVEGWGLSWEGRVPDHTTIARAFASLDPEWLDRTVSLTADMCLDEADKASEIGCGRLAADSTGVETDRYGVQERPSKKEGDFKPVRVKTYLKWHILAAVGLQVILSCRMTASNVADTTVFTDLLDGTGRMRRRLEGWSVLADRGYDSDSNDRAVFDLGMHPNIKQKANAKNRGKLYRRRAAGEFDPDLYKRRGMVEAIFGAAETADHRLYCRYRTTETQARFGPTLAICMNVETLNRIRCAVDLGHPLTVA